MLDRDTYFESLKCQFKDDLKMVLAQWHGHNKDECLDNKTLGDMIYSLYRFALKGGISEDEWFDILHDVDPEQIDKSIFTKIAI